MTGQMECSCVRNSVGPFLTRLLGLCLSVLRLHMEQDEKVTAPNCTQGTCPSHSIYYSQVSLGSLEHGLRRGSFPVVSHLLRGCLFGFSFGWFSCRVRHSAATSLDSSHLHQVSPAQKDVSTSTNGLHVALLRPRTRVDFLFRPAPLP